MISVNEAIYKGDYKIWCQFSDGECGVVNLEKELWGPVFDPLRDKEMFKKFKISNILHTIAWENGADLAPEFLHDNIQR